MNADGDWLQLTDEDIARAHQLVRAQPAMPEVITISPDDIPDDVAAPQSGESILTISSEDLAPVQAQDKATVHVSELESMMFEMVNAARKEHLPGWLGTAALKRHDRLAAIARGHSQDMLKRQYVAHVTPEGLTAARRIGLQGLSYVACGENIGIFYGDASHTRLAVEDIHNAFMNQPRSLTNHRGNLLNPIWTHVGIGIAHNPDGALVATQNFISAPATRLRGR
jgi:uncharacterized protein YkwD